MNAFTNADVLATVFPETGGGAQVPAWGWTEPESGIREALVWYRDRMEDERRQEEIERLVWERLISRSEAVRIINGTIESEVARWTHAM
jgi:hypothetical protein